ncbi:MAG: histidine kinase [Micavibrio aeruginosavorus]|uniref:histidine kinase n=1 Tax=Micavibrio aeruginosavorus TaxID=349221 RepID=A0A2W5FP84_9BACT|nr:MAG: histidine kinase [Micavibrio aeruginosavorus]
MANPLKSFLGITDLEAEKSRLEAFLTAFPGEYCGFSKDSAVAFSPHFPDTLNLKTVTDFADIQQALRPGDDAALESCFRRLQEQGTRFSLKVRSLDQSRLLRFSGSKGKDQQGVQNYDILWIEDVTEIEKEIETLRDSCTENEESFRRLQAALDSFPNPVWIRDKRNQIIWTNRPYSELLVSTPEKVIAQQQELNFTKKPGSRSLAELSSVALSTNTEQKDKRHMIVQGDRRLYEMTITPIPHLDYSVGHILDITKEEETLKDVERNAATTKELFEHLSSPLAVYNKDYRLEYYNSAYSQFWHLDEQWLNSQPRMSEIIDRLRETRMVPEQADFRIYKQSLVDTFSKMISPSEEMHYLPNGMTLRMMVFPRPAGGVMIMWEDVTSHLELESSYNTLVAVQKETLDNLAEGVAAFGGDGRLKLWNPSFPRLWRLNPEDMEGTPHITRIVEKLKPLFADNDWENAKTNLLAQGLDRNMRDGVMRRNDGTVIEFAAVPLPDGGMLVTHTDITDTIRVETALREKTAALEAAEKLKLEFIANVSYQLRTPLNAIIGFTEILDKEYFGTLNERQKGYTRGLSEAGERLMSLINDILDLASIEAGYMALETAEMNIHDMLKGLYDLTVEWARSQRIEVSLSCPADIGTVMADERRMKQIMLNLIRNSIEFTQAGGRITLIGERRGDYVGLSVADTGPGISEEDQEKIFKPFEKTDAQRDDGEGNVRGGAGLGLTLVKDIVELHNGKVELKSELGVGTTTTLLLPAGLQSAQEA